MTQQPLNIPQQPATPAPVAQAPVAQQAPVQIAQVPAGIPLPPGVERPASQQVVALSDYSGLPGYEGVPMYFVGYTNNGKGNYAKFATAKRDAGVHAMFVTGVQIHKSLLASEPQPGVAVFLASINWSS